MPISYKTQNPIEVKRVVLFYIDQQVLEMAKRNKYLLHFFRRLLPTEMHTNRTQTKCCCIYHIQHIISFERHIRTIVLNVFEILSFYTFFGKGIIFFSLVQIMLKNREYLCFSKEPMFILRYK